MGKIENTRTLKEIYQHQEPIAEYIGYDPLEIASESYIPDEEHAPRMVVHNYIVGRGIWVLCADMDADTREKTNYKWMKVRRDFEGTPYVVKRGMHFYLEWSRKELPAQYHDQVILATLKECI